MSVGSTKYISNLDLGGNRLIHAAFESVSGIPISSGTQGQFIYNSDDNRPYYFNGTDWVEFSLSNPDLDVDSIIVDGYTIDTNTFTDGGILISTTNSVADSGYKFNDIGTSSNDIWSADKIDNRISERTLVTKSGIALGTNFAGNPKIITITFNTTFPDNNYAVTVTGEVSRSWSIQSKSASSFTINANANQAFTGNVFWIAVKTGETN